MEGQYSTTDARRERIRATDTMDASRKTEWVKIREDAEVDLWGNQRVQIMLYYPPSRLPKHKTLARLCQFCGRRCFQNSIQTYMASDITLPGQPISLPRGPIPQLGSGIYSRDGQVRASLVGVPCYEGSVGLQSSMHSCCALE